METPTKTKLLTSLKSSTHVTTPFDYWLLDDVLPARVCDTIAALPFDPPKGATFDGRREANNSTRVYFSPENQSKFAVMQDLCDAFRAIDTKRTIEALTGTNLAQGQLRIEYCQDVDGFWLEPHLDISVKLFTMLVYLSDDPNLRDAGTDIYDDTPAHNLVTSAPYERNKGLIFIPGKNTWHGFTKRPIRGLRKSIIINYVTKDWRAREELA